MLPRHRQGRRRRFQPNSQGLTGQRSSGRKTSKQDPRGHSRRSHSLLCFPSSAPLSTSASRSRNGRGLPGKDCHGPQSWVTWLRGQRPLSPLSLPGTSHPRKGRPALTARSPASALPARTGGGGRGEVAPVGPDSVQTPARRAQGPQSVTPPLREQEGSAQPHLAGIHKARRAQDASTSGLTALKQPCQVVIRQFLRGASHKRPGQDREGRVGTPGPVTCAPDGAFMGGRPGRLFP